MEMMFWGGLLIGITVGLVLALVIHGLVERI